MTPILPKIRALQDQSQEDWNPNTWTWDHEHRIYGDERAQTWAVVSEEDYQWAIQWRWNWSRKRNGLYLRRTVHVYENGARVRTETIYLHTEIMKRTGIEPKSSKHRIVDHRDGDPTNNKRTNLRWTNHSENTRNSFGKHPAEFEMKDPTLFSMGHNQPRVTTD